MKSSPWRSNKKDKMEVTVWEAAYVQEKEVVSVGSEMRALNSMRQKPSWFGRWSSECQLQLNGCVFVCVLLADTCQVTSC